MKRFMTVLAVIMSFAAAACADNDKAISFDRLPEKAQQFIREYFPSEKIAYVKMEREFAELSYEVMFVQGAMVEFDRRGRWTDIECRYRTLDSRILPPAIASYIASDWAGQACRKISRDRNQFEVKLVSGIELTFDRNYNLMGIDD